MRQAIGGGLVLALAIGGAAGAHAAMLQGSEWKPLLIDGEPVPVETGAFVQFRSKGRLEGYSGCNRLVSEYETHGNQILIGPVAATRRACVDTVMQREAALATALEQARTWYRERTRLVLFDAGGVPILELRQTDWD
ncbi:MAG: META domain-containing protein [Gammaproteobacteria bacterium]|nr:META domain-containing protein [Gammaproteobacteria bacterium]